MLRGIRVGGAHVVSTCSWVLHDPWTHFFAAGPLLNAELAVPEEITAAVVEASRVHPDEKVGAIGPNITGGADSGRADATRIPFWIRDYAMSLDSGLVAPDEQRHVLLLTAMHQQDSEWRLANGSVVTPGSVPDHVSFGNKPIFYPGTLEDYEGQGGPRWGILPSLDDAYFFIEMAHHYAAQTNDRAIVAKDVRGKPLLQRLEEAYRMTPSRPDTGLVYADDSNRGVTFGFVDTIFHTGDLLFCSLLKFQAAQQLAELLEGAGRAAMRRGTARAPRGFVGDRDTLRWRAVSPRIGRTQRSA